MCPKNKEIVEKCGLNCVYQKESPPCFMAQHLGMAVAVVPKGLLDNWEKEAYTCFGDPKGKTGGAISPVYVRAHELSKPTWE
jgi:hypothetical protein